MEEKISISGIPVLKKGNFIVNFPRAISELESAMRKFPVKRILYKMVFRGRGLEFDSYRKFEANDDAWLIDWKASLRANSLLARKYIEERDLNVYFLFDVGNSMLFGSGNKLKAEYAAELIAALSHLILESGDRVGLVMFSDKIMKVLYPSKGKNQFAILTSFLSNPNNYGGGVDFNRAIEYVMGSLKSAYNVFILVSDFIGFLEKDRKSLNLMGNRFETIAILVRDAWDEKLPPLPYQFAVQDPYSNRQMLVEPGLISEKYNKSVNLQKARLKEIFKKSKVDSLNLVTNKSFAVPFVAFLKSRAVGERV